jgi:osmotically-inducible protein OsmY
MSRDYERDDRETYWRRQEQGREPQNRWSSGNREEDYGWNPQDRDQQGWRRNEEHDRNRETMRDRERFGREGTRYGGGRERGPWQGGEHNRWGNEGADYGTDWQQRTGQRWGEQGRYREGMERSGWQGKNWEGGRTADYGGWHGRTGTGWQGGYENEQQYVGDEWNERMGGQSFGGRGMTGQGTWNAGMKNWSERGEMGGMQGRFTGRGPRNYKRSDQRIEEDINEKLTQHPMLDASDLEVHVQNGEVTLRGHVDHRDAKRWAEDITESVFGVKDVNNQIKVRTRGEGEESGHETETSGKRERKVS